MQLVEAYARAVDILRDAGIDSFTSNARLILMDLTGVDENIFFTGGAGPELSDETQRILWNRIKRRADGEPLELVLGWTYFFDSKFFIEPGVFNPRPDTEVLVEHALEYLQSVEGEGPLSCMDLCCGSGVVGLSVALSDERVRLISTDISADAVALTRRNIEYHDLEDRARAEQTDLYPEEHTHDGLCALILANPPYISREEGLKLPREVVDYDPPSSLYGGEDGLDPHRRILERLPEFLRKGGAVMMEIGWKQGDASRKVFESAGLSSVQIFDDYAGHSRVATGVLP